MFEYDVIVSRSETTIIRVEAKDHFEALKKAEAEVLFPDDPIDVVWIDDEDYQWNVQLVSK